MLEEAERQTPELVRATYEHGYREMRAAGFTAVGEFHYLGVDEALAAAEAAEAAGIVLVLLHVAYARGGLPRMRQESVAEYLAQVERLQGAEIPTALAPHSVRACPVDWLEEIGRYAVAQRSAAARPCRRAAEGDRGVPRRARLPADRAARATRAASPSGRPSCTRRTRTVPSSTCSRPTARRSARARRPRPTSATASFPPSACAPRDPDLHRLRLERPHRPVRGAARARGHRAATDWPARRVLDRRAARGRRRDRRSLARNRELAGDRDRPRAPLAARRRAGSRARGAHRRLRGRCRRLVATVDRWTSPRRRSRRRSSSAHATCPWSWTSGRRGAVRAGR